MWMFRYLQVDWTGVMLTDDMEHVTKQPSKGPISIWTDDDLKHIDPREPYQIYSICRVQNTLWIRSKVQMETPDYF